MLRYTLCCFVLGLLLSNVGGLVDYWLLPVATTKSQTIDQVYGLNINVYNNTWNSSAWIDKLVRSNATWVRAELRYFNESAPLDRDHQQSYNDTFSMLKLVKDAGLKVLGILDEKTSEFNKTSNDFSPITNLTQWRNIADGVLAGYGELLDAVEMWNEPDLVNLTKAAEQNWYMNASPQNYVNMLQILYDEVKSYDTHMQVLAGALGTVRTTNSTPGWGYGGYFLENMSALNSDSYCDCYSIHVYDGYLYPYTNASEGLYNATDAYNKAKSIVGDKPVWITELGANHLMSEQNQADFMENSLANLKSWRDCPNIMWYCYYNPRPEEGSSGWDGIEPPHGIVRQDANLTERPAYSVFQFFVLQVGVAIYIRANGSIDPTTAPIATLDNVTYTLTGNIYDGIVVQRDNIVLNGVGYIVTGSGSGNGTTLTNRSNVTLRNMTIKNFDYGIFLDLFSDNDTLSDNNLANNSYGIHLISSSGNVLSGNNVTANNDAGIWLGSSSDNTLSGNDVTANNVYGIWLDSSSNNTISGNNITENEWDGIILVSSSNYNSVSGNNITNNGNGISLSGTPAYSSNNKIYHNNFVNNTLQVYSGSINAWDNGYPSGGNYWSDYNGMDSNHDGIGDTPYVIDANNVDHYPLMVQTVIPEFPSFLILPLFFVTTLLAVVAFRRKRGKFSLLALSEQFHPVDICDIVKALLNQL